MNPALKKRPSSQQCRPASDFGALDQFYSLPKFLNPRTPWPSVAVYLGKNRFIALGPLLGRTREIGFSSCEYTSGLYSGSLRPEGYRAYKGSGFKGSGSAGWAQEARVLQRQTPAEDPYWLFDGAQTMSCKP